MYSSSRPNYHCGETVSMHLINVRLIMHMAVRSSFSFPCSKEKGTTPSNIYFEYWSSNPVSSSWMCTIPILITSFLEHDEQNCKLYTRSGIIRVLHRCIMRSHLRGSLPWQMWGSLRNNIFSLRHRNDWTFSKKYWLIQPRIANI